MHVYSKSWFAAIGNALQCLSEVEGGLAALATQDEATFRATGKQAIRRLRAKTRRAVDRLNRAGEQEREAEAREAAQTGA